MFVKVLYWYRWLLAGEERAGSRVAFWVQLWLGWVRRTEV